MVIPKNKLRMVVTQSSYRMANRLKQILVLADYEGRNVREVIEAHELLDTLQLASPIHLAMLTTAIVTDLEASGLSNALVERFPNVALVLLADEDAKATASRTTMIPDCVLTPPLTAESMDQAIAAALDNRQHRTLAAQHIAQGELAMNRGDWQDAQDEFEDAIRLCKTDPYPCYALGELFVKRGDIPRALQYFNQAWEKDPQYVKAIQRLVDLLFSQGNRHAAIPYLEKVAVTGTAPVDLLGLLVGLYVETGASEQAKAIFEKTCKISVPLALATVRDQVQSLLDQHEFQTAMELLRIGIDAQPENTDLHGLLGDLYMKLDRPRDALTSYENITRLGRPMPANYCRLARVYLALGFHLRAEKAVQQALHLDPECQEAAELRVAVAR